VQRMVMARIRTIALAAGGLSALAAAVAAAALISLIVHPDQLAMAASSGDFFETVTMIVRHVVAVCARVVRLF